MCRLFAFAAVLYKVLRLSECLIFTSSKTLISLSEPRFLVASTLATVDKTSNVVSSPSILPFKASEPIETAPEAPLTRSLALAITLPFPTPRALDTADKPSDKAPATSPFTAFLTVLVPSLTVFAILSAFESIALCLLANSATLANFVLLTAEIEPTPLIVPALDTTVFATEEITPATSPFAALIATSATLAAVFMPLPVVDKPLPVVLNQYQLKR